MSSARCGRPSGAFSLRTIPRPRPGCLSRGWRSSKAAPQGHRAPACGRPAQGGRSLCRLPAPQTTPLLGLPDGLSVRLADCDRHHRGGLPPSGERSVRYPGSAVGVGGVRGGLETSRSVEQWRLGGLLGVLSGPRTATGPCCAVRGRDPPRRRLMAADSIPGAGAFRGTEPNVTGAVRIGLTLWG